jgi:HlyD family secretion protein
MSAAQHAEDEPRAIGPQGDALILELRRLQWALARERKEARGKKQDRPPPSAHARPRVDPSDRPRTGSHGHPGAPDSGRETETLDPRFRGGERVEGSGHVAAPSVAPDADVGPQHIMAANQQALRDACGAPPNSGLDVTTLDPRVRGGERIVEAIGRLDLRPRLDRAVTHLRAGADFLLGRSAVEDLPGADFVARVHRAFERELRASLRVLVISTVVGGGWASFVPLSGAVVLPGSLVVESSVKKVQHPNGGVVAAISVRDGLHVEAGALLVRLDETQVRASGQVIANGLDQIRMRIARLTAERDGAELRVPPALAGRQDDPAIAQLVASERALFVARASTRRGQKELLQANIGQFSEQIGGLEAQARSKSEQLQIIAGEMNGVRELYGKGLVPLARLTTLQREQSRLEGERGQLTSALAETRAKIGQAQLQMVQIDQDFRSEVMKDLREQQDKEAELSEKNVAAQDQLRHIDIRAPVAGTVHELAAHTVGGVIKPGDTILEIVPDADALEIEARLPPNEIDQVRRGQTASMRFSAFNQRTTPQVEGLVSYVSADLSRDAQSNSSYYTVRVTLSGDERRRLDGFNLVSGMPVEVFVRSGSRTMLSYLMKPITDQLHRMFNER